MSIKCNLIACAFHLLNGRTGRTADRRMNLPAARSAVRAILWVRRSSARGGYAEVHLLDRARLARGSGRCSTRIDAADAVTAAAAPAGLRPAAGAAAVPATVAAAAAVSVSATDAGGAAAGCRLDASDVRVD